MRRDCQWAMLWGTLLLVGCGGDALKPPVDVYPVSGKVTYNGKPLVGADVTFLSQEQDRSAFGRTNDEGEYQLTTFSSNDGAVKGKHLVTIVKASEPAPPAPDDQSANYVPPDPNARTPPPPKNTTFPAKYGDKATSGLVAVVNPDAPQPVNFDLKD